MTPKVELVILVSGASNVGWLRTLNASIRNWKYRCSPTANFLITEASKLLMPSWRRLLNVVGNVRIWNCNWPVCWRALICAAVSGGIFDELPFVFEDEGVDPVTNCEVLNAVPSTLRGSRFRFAGNVPTGRTFPFSSEQSPLSCL